MKSIPHSKLQKSPNSNALEEQRKRVYDMISQKIASSTSSVNTLNDNETEPSDFHNEDLNQPYNNGQYQLDDKS